MADFGAGDFLRSGRHNGTFGAQQLGGRWFEPRI